MEVFESRDGESLILRIMLDPVPAARPRVAGTGHTYYPKSYSRFRKQMKDEFAAWNIPRLSGPLDVDTYIYRAPPKTLGTTVRCGKRWAWPKGDNDNYEKAVWDAMNEVVWEDDDQIVDSHTYKRYGDPRIIVVVRRAKGFEGWEGSLLNE